VTRITEAIRDARSARERIEKRPEPRDLGKQIKGPLACLDPSHPSPDRMSVNGQASMLYVPIDGADGGRTTAQSAAVGQPAHDFAAVMMRSNKLNGRLPDNPVAQSLGHSLGLGMHLQLIVNAAQVKADGVHRDIQFRGCGLMIVAFHEQLQDADFVRG